MRLAYFTPLPPSKSGIADYNLELLPHLARGAEIDVFVALDREMRENGGREDFSVYNSIHFDEINGQQPYDLCIYHQGNNPYHEYVYDRAIETPGLLVFHEHCLHHLLAWKTLGRDDRDAYWNEMFYAYGHKGARIAEMRAGGVGSEYQQFALPLNKRLVGRSLGVVVHNRFAASQLEGLDPEVPLEVIPHHLSPKAYELDGWDKAEIRRSLGIPEDAWVIASLGFVTQSKRIPAVLAAFKKLLSIMPNALYIIAGEDHWKWSVAPLIDDLELGDKVRITGYVTEKDFFRYLKALDVMVNLRFPTAGETSGTLVRALGAGKPVIVSDYGQFGELPGDICFKVAPGPDEEHELYARLRELAYRPILRENLGRRAAAWTRENCDIEKSAARYLEFAERVIARRKRGATVNADYRLEFRDEPAIAADPEEALEYVRGFFTEDANATGYLQKHGQRIVETLELIPRGTGTEKLLELSSYLQMAPLVMKYGNYARVEVTNWWAGKPSHKRIGISNSETGEKLEFKVLNLDVERDAFPFPDNHFDVALCCELIEHLTADPMHMLIELNRVLRWGGLLVLTTPNISSAFSLGKALAGNSPYVYGEYNPKSPGDRHSREYAPSEIKVALNAAGFKAVRLYTRDLWCQTDEPFLRWLDQTGVPRSLRGDNIFAVGRKLSTVFDRYPDGLYD